MTDPTFATLVLLCFLTAKHLIADFVLQSRYILDNRRFYGHPAGLLHVGIHVTGTLMVLAAFGTPFGLISMMIAVEAAVHYHVDWAKDNAMVRFALTPADRSFWIAIGVDQMLHQLTYIGLAAWWHAAV